MASLYPRNVDSYRAWLNTGVDMMIADDINNMFDSIVAIQTEMGVEPSGLSGTVFGRLFAKGNLSLAVTGWMRLVWGQGGAQGSQFGTGDTSGFAHAYRAGTHDINAQTAFDLEGVPGIFGALQSPVDTGGGGRAGIPWTSWINFLGDTQCRFVGFDVQTLGSDLSLISTNSNPCTFAVLEWSLKT